MIVEKLKLKTLLSKVLKKLETVESTARNGHIYLPNNKVIYGGTTKGIWKSIFGMSTGDNVFIGGSSYADFGNTNIYAGTGSVQLFTSLGAVLLYKDATNGYNVFRPNNNGTTYLGSSSYRWRTVNCTAVNSTGSISGTSITGTGTVTGTGFRVSGHDQNIGYIQTPSSTTDKLSSSTTNTLIGPEMELTAGTWFIGVSVSFPSNSTGRRSIAIHRDGSVLTHTYVNQNATSGAATRLRTFYAVTTPGIYRIGAYQNSGSQLEVTCYAQYFRIA